MFRSGKNETSTTSKSRHFGIAWLAYDGIMIGMLLFRFHFVSIYGTRLFLKSTPRLSYVIGVEKSFFGIAGTFPIGKHVKKLKKLQLSSFVGFLCVSGSSMRLHVTQNQTQPKTTREKMFSVQMDAPSLEANGSRVCKCCQMTCEL